MKPVLRLLADDLTGALDTAAALTGLCGPVALPLRHPGGAIGSLAFDSETREAGRQEASARVARHIGMLAGGDLAYKKLDSLLRGHAAAEIATCLRAGPWRHCVLAPAFPALGRITRGGRQFMLSQDGGWVPVGPGDLITMLAAEGVAARPGRLDLPLPEGVSVFDAETDADLARIVALGRAVRAPVLWCGTAGLAGALAGAEPVPPDHRLAQPVLGLFGSDQPVTARQLAACGRVALRLPDPDPEAARRVGRRMEATGAAMVSLDLAADLGRAEAARRIAEVYASLLGELVPPGTLLVAGGETLRGICGALGAEAILATGLVAPGVPRATLQGGRWDGLTLVTKSGAFGGPTLWRDLLAGNGIVADGAPGESGSTACRSA